MTPTPVLIAALSLALVPSVHSKPIWVSPIDCGTWIKARAAGDAHGEWYLVGLIDGLVLCLSNSYTAWCCWRAVRARTILARMSSPLACQT